jgi:hypothetical protein
MSKKSKSTTCQSTKKKCKTFNKQKRNTCNCEQKFYIPLPALTYPSNVQQSNKIPETWMGVGLVETCGCYKN